MKTLRLSDLSDADELASPSKDASVTLASAAIEVFTDFAKHRPLVINSTATATEAQALMKRMHVRLKFVTAANRHFLGIVSRDDLNSRSIITRLAEENSERDELLVTDFMTPRSCLKAFSYEGILQAKIEDIVEALKHHGEQHCLVVDKDQHKIRGIFSSSDIARKLHLDIDIQNRSSFVHIFEAVQNQHETKPRLASA